MDIAVDLSGLQRGKLRRLQITADLANLHPAPTGHSGIAPAKSDFYATGQTLNQQIALGFNLDLRPKGHVDGTIAPTFHPQRAIHLLDGWGLV